MERSLYLVNGEENGVHIAKVMYAEEIFDMMDKEECEGLVFDLWRINGWGEVLTECAFLRKGFDKSEPNKMMIVGGGRRESR